MARQTSPPSPQPADKAQSETKPKHAQAPASERITPAVVGDWVPPLGGMGPQHVTPHCGATAPGSYACIPCAQYLANQYQLELHTQQGSHCIARVCCVPGHGCEAIT
jgi:hypothetical protein